MNRENKRKTFEKGYYKDHPCNDSFTCKVCGRLVTPDAAGTDHRNHCPNCLSSLHVDIEPGDREADCGGIRIDKPVRKDLARAVVIDHDIGFRRKVRQPPKLCGRGNVNTE